MKRKRHGESGRSYGAGGGVDLHIEAQGGRGRVVHLSEDVELLARHKSLFWCINWIRWRLVMVASAPCQPFPGPSTGHTYTGVFCALSL